MNKNSSKATSGYLKKMETKYLDALLSGDRNSASKMILNAVENGTSVKDIYLNVFQPSQYKIGELWQTNKISVAQEHYCSAATQLIMSQLYPNIFSSEKIGRTLVAACVGNELHEIGIRMVADFFEMEGWDTYYLGANSPLESILAALKENKTDVLAISVTISFNMNRMKEIIKTIKNDKTGGTVKILVGGRPFNNNHNLWRDVNADGFAFNADSAIKTAEKLVNKNMTT